MTYKLEHTLVGGLYLHDIRMGGVGQRNLRMLEEMIGIEKWNHCTLVTTKWGCTANPRIEEKREKDFREKPHLFGPMMQNANSATMVRFAVQTKGQALAILKPTLTKKFAPQISV